MLLRVSSLGLEFRGKGLIPEEVVFAARQGEENGQHHSSPHDRNLRCPGVAFEM